MLLGKLLTAGGWPAVGVAVPAAAVGVAAADRGGEVGGSTYRCASRGDGAADNEPGLACPANGERW